MDPVRNPYAPGAGSPPPELAGRDSLIEQVRTAILRISQRRPAKSVLMVGLRGVGKTVLLEQMHRDAEANHACAIRLEAAEDRSLPGLLAPALRSALMQLNRFEAARSAVERGLSALAGFVRGMKVKYKDVEVALDKQPERGLADNGDLEQDLNELLQHVGIAAQHAGVAVVIFIDELQYVKEKEFGILVSALHQCSRRELPITMVGAGLPQLVALAGKAKSYSERLFDFPVVGALSPEDARIAIVNPAREEEVEFEAGAVDQIVEVTQGYPYFLQEWGKHSWDVAESSPIRLADVEQATLEAIAALDASFFRVRFDRLTPAEKRYLRAMAELGDGRHRSGDIAEVMGRPVEKLSPVRNNLIRKGMLWSPAHGETAFTVPLFDRYMRRIMPGSEWRD